jgi:hypothetical protein
MAETGRALVLMEKLWYTESQGSSGPNRRAWEPGLLEKKEPEPPGVGKKNPFAA